MVRSAVRSLASWSAVRYADPPPISARQALAAVFAAAVALVPVAAQPAVFGADNRSALPATLRHLESSIGILYETRTRTVCTAFCVGDDMIATASHCLFRTSGEDAPKLSGFTFRPASKPAKAVTKIAGVESGGGAENIVAGSMRLSIRPPIEATRDWALVRLAAPVCRGRALAVSARAPADIKQLAEAGRIYQVAYHHDLPSWRLTLGGPCWMRRGEVAVERQTISRDFADTRDLVLHSCDTGGASSGSPLLFDGPAGPEVVAINVGTYIRSKVMMQNGDVVHRYKSDTIANTAVGSGAFAERLAAFKSAVIVSGRPSIKELQGLLAERGHYRGPLDGVYGVTMRTAIESFERADRRSVTGIASAALRDRLLALRPAALSRAEGEPVETGSVTPSRGKRRD
ncbi:MAG: peptidoglycan-binding protein [Hyphomicrobium sp.]